MPRHEYLILPLSLAFGCKGKEVAESPTYTRDVAPIVDSRCLGCHVDGGIAPFSLEGYDNVALYADLVANAVADRRMPPGEANGACQTYVFDPSLPDDDIETIVSWADSGAARGEDSDAVETEVAQDPEALDRVDLEIQMSEPYTPTNAPDDYRCFLVDWPEEAQTYVTGFGIEPGNADIVHHVILYAIPPANRATYEALDDAEEGPGYTCFGGPGAANPTDRPQWLGGWVPGQEGRNTPEGTGISVEPGSLIIMEVHYNLETSALVTADQSTMLFRVDDAVDHEGVTTPFADPNWVLNGEMVIPAGTDAMSFSFTKELTSDMVLHDVGMHMHTHGTSGTIQVKDAEGAETCALQIDDWDFHWQRSYRLNEALALGAGSSMTVTCNFTNPTDADLAWGEGTADEMCLGVTYLSYAE